MPSYFRRNVSWELVQYVPAPTAGWNPDAVPWELPNTQAQVLDNFILRPGHIQARGAFSATADISATASKPAAVVPVGNVLVASQTNTGYTPWDAPVVGASANTNAQANTTLTWADILGTVVTNTVASRHLVPGPRWINFDGQLYGLGFDSEATQLRDAASSYYMPATQVLTMPFSTGITTINSSLGIPSSNSGTNWVAHGGGVPRYEYNATVAPNSQTSYLVSTSMGLAISGTAFNISASCSFYTQDSIELQTALSCQLVYAGSPIGSASVKVISANSTVNFSFTDFGSPALTPTIVNASTFGVQVRFLNPTSGITAPANNFQIYFSPQVQVSYSLPFTPPTVTAYSAAPQGAVDIIGYLGAVWLLGGADTPSGGTAHSSTTLYYTNPGPAGIGASAGDWKDVHSGLTNRIEIDQDSSDPGVGLAVAKTGLLIFRRNSIWIMRGTTPSNFTVQQINADIGCLDPRSIVATDNGIYFMSQRGMMLTDGAKVTNISGGVMYTLQQAIAYQQYQVVAGYGGWITSALTSQGQIIVSIGKRTSNATTQPIWCAMYDVALNGWVRVTSLLFNADGNQAANNPYPSLLVSDRVSALRSVFAVGSKWVTMFESQEISYSFLNQSALYDTDKNGVTYTIPLNWTTKFFPIIGTGTYQRKWSKAKRYMLDHTFATTTAGFTYGWTAVPQDATNTPYPGVSLQSSVANSTTASSVSGFGFTANPTIQRDNEDFVFEIDDFSIAVTYQDANANNNNTAANVIANIYGVAVEYEPYGRDRR